MVLQKGIVAFGLMCVMLMGCNNVKWQDVYSDTLNAIHNQESLDIATDDEDINKLGKEQVFADGFFITNITGDEIPELVVRFGMCEAEYDCKVFTCDGSNGLVYIGSFNGGHSQFYQTPDSLVRRRAHMGSSVMNRISYVDGEFVEEQIFEESDVTSADLYTDVEDIVDGAEELEFRNINDFDLKEAY